TFGIYVIACALLFRALIISGLLLCNRSILTEFPGLRKGTGNSERCGKSQSEMESLHTDSPPGVRIDAFEDEIVYIPPQQPQRRRLLPSQIAQNRRNPGALVLETPEHRPCRFGRPPISTVCTTVSIVKMFGRTE